MLKRLSAVLWILLAAATAIFGAALGDQTGPARSADLTVHEWGTFTSVAGADGKPVEWTPFGGPSDLPCFVTLLNPTSLKVGPKGFLPTVRATVRMETPVIYFYTPRAQTVDVTVRFPEGLITEWYPQGAVPPVVPVGGQVVRNGGIDWRSVSVSPGTTPDLPAEPGGSHYYAARETDAAPVAVGSQQEKFLFYRGIARFSTPLAATIDAAGRVAIENTSEHDVRTLVVFSKVGSLVGYRVVRDAVKQTTVPLPALTGSVDSLRRDLQTVLVEEGLYPREAKAMVDTWHDSWFEEGTRIFYLIPQPSVDTILPLTIDPQPGRVVRVFVGRLEIITASVRTTVERAIRQNDLTTLARFSRFIEPITALIRDQSNVPAMLRSVAASTVALQKTCSARPTGP